MSEKQKYEIRFLPGAEKNLEKISKQDAKYIILKTNKHLSINPLPRGNIIKKITNTFPAIYRLRASHWRIFFEIEKNIVWVLAIARKPSANKIIRRLRK